MTEATSYVDFRARSAFSFLEGASLPEDLVHRAASLGHAAMDLMDRDNLSGAPRFYMAARKELWTRHVQGRIVSIAGPWRSSGDWWRPDTWGRDEFDLLLSDGALYRLVRDSQSRKRLLEGSYD